MKIKTNMKRFGLFKNFYSEFIMLVGNSSCIVFYLILGNVNPKIAHYKPTMNDY